MADNTVNIGINVSDNNSTNKVTNNVKDLKDLLDKTAAAAARVNVGGSRGGGSAGGGSAGGAGGGGSAGGGGGTPSTRALSASPAGVYGAQRAVAGGTGSAASDFAQEAQGLGGLVKAYAVVAANVYAVQAAYKALSEAMNTTHLAQGIDQLGAASGRGLGTLAKNLNEVTGGALTMRGSMQAVAQMTAANMSSENIVKLGVVARNASQALGRDMAEAVDRLSLGISKQQPKLLDELGILVNVTKAHADYALKIGKSTTELTDFENRQAFANAALEQGMKKFGAIEIDTNPYQRLEASISNTTQSFLAFINKVAGPVAGFFADNKAALVTLGVVVGNSLLKMAIPALNQYGAGLASAAAKSKASLETMKLGFQEAFVAKTGESLGIPKLTKQLDDYDAKLKSIKGTKITSGLPSSDAVNRVIAAGAGKADIADMEAINNEIKYRSRLINQLQKDTTTANTKQIAENQAIKASLLEIRAVQTGAAPVLKEFNAAHDTLHAQASVPVRRGSPEAGAQRSIDRQSVLASNLQALSNVGENVGGITGSMRKGFVNLWKDVDLASTKLTNLGAIASKTATLAAGSLMVIGKGISTFLSAFGGPILMAITAVMLVFEGLEAIWGKGSKEADTLKTSLDSLNEAGKTAGRTLDFIYKTPEKANTTETLMALANASTEISSGITKAGQDLAAFNKEIDASKYEKFWQAIKSGFGGGAVKNTAKEVAYAVEQQLRLASGTKAGATAAAALAEEFGTASESVAGMTYALSQSPDKIAKVEQISVNLNTALRKSGDAAQGLNLALEAGVKSLEALYKAAMPTDVIAKVGTDQMKIGAELAKSFETPKSALIAMLDLLKDPEKFSLLDPNTAKQILDAREKLDGFNKALQSTEQGSKIVDDEISKLKDKLSSSLAYIEEVKANKNYSPETKDRIIGSEKGSLLHREDYDRLEGLIRGKAILAGATDKILSESQVVSDNIKKGLGDTFIDGAQKVQNSIGMAFAKAALSMEKIKLMGQTGEGTAAAQYKMTIKELDIQQTLIDTQIALIEETTKSRVELEKSNNLSEIKNAKEDLASKKITQAQYDEKMPKLEMRNKVTDEKLKMLSTPGGLANINKMLEESKKTVNAAVPPIMSVTGVPTAGAKAIADKAEAQKQANRELLITGQQLAAQQAAKAQITADKATAAVKKALDAEKEIITQKLQLNTEAGKTLQLAQANNAFMKEGVGLESDIYLKKQGEIDLQLIQNAQEAERLAFENKRFDLQTAISHNNKDAQKGMDNLMASERVRLTQSQIAINNAKEKQSIEEETWKISKLARDAERDQAMKDRVLERQKALLDVTKSELDARIALGRVGETAAAYAKADIAYMEQKATYTDQISKAAKADQEARNKITGTNAPLIAAAAATKGPAQPSEALQEQVDALAAQKALAPLLTIQTTQLEDQRKIYNDIVATINVQNDANNRKTSIMQDQALILAEQNKALTDQKYAMDNLVFSVNSLALVFGDVGKKFGDGLVGILQATQDASTKRLAIDLQYSKDKTDIESTTAQYTKDIMADPMLTGEQQAAISLDIQASADKKKISLDQKYQKDSGNLEFDKNAKVISSTKKMFSEKTAAYKILDAVEKSQHILKLGLEAKEVAMTLWAEGKKLWAKVFTAEAGTAAATIAATEEIALDETTSAMSVTAATPGIFAKFTEQMGWYGWAAAAAVVAALGGMAISGGGSGPPAGFTAAEQQKVQGTGQEYKNGALVDRAGGVLGDSKATAKSIVDSIDILGKVFFDVLGSGSSDMLQYLKGIQEATQQTAKALIGSGLFGEGATKNVSSSSSLGFSKSSTTVEDAGIKVTGTLDNIATGLGKIAGYENITQKSSSWWGLSSSSNSFTQDVKISDAVKKNISNIFVNVKGALVAAGTALEGSGIRVADLINQIPIELKVSSLGLTASEFADKLLAEISVKLNAAAEQAFPYISKYVKVGEEMYSTVARIVKEGETLNTGLDMIGKSIAGVATAGNWFSAPISAAEDAVTKQQTLLSKFAGGIDEFTTSVQFYFDNFKSATEKSTFYTSTLTKGFKDMGISAIPTADEFNKMVNSLDVTTEAGAGVFASLMKLAPGMDRYNKELETTAALNVTLMETQGNAAGALAAKRALEYKAMTTVDAGIQRHIYALQDQAKAQTAVESALNNTITSIRGSIDNLTNYQTSLTMGAQSTLTSEQKYNKAKQTLIDTAAAAQGPTDTPEQLKIQAAAASKLQSASTDFLTASGVMFNSTEQYATDLASVQNLVGDTITSLGATESIAETQLDQIKKSTGHLSSIDANTQSTLDLFNQYFAAVDVSKAAAATPFTVDAVSPITANQLTQNALLIEQNRLTQAQIDATNAAAAATITSNAAVVAKQTELLQAMAEQAARDAAYYNNSQVQSDQHS